LESDDQKSCVENVREERTQQRNEMMKTGKGREGKERKGKEKPKRYRCHVR